MFYQPLFSTSAAAETECVPVFLSLSKSRSKVQSRPTQDASKRSISQKEETQNGEKVSFVSQSNSDDSDAE